MTHYTALAEATQDNLAICPDLYTSSRRGKAKIKRLLGLINKHNVRISLSASYKGTRQFPFVKSAEILSLFGIVVGLDAWARYLIVGRRFFIPSKFGLRQTWRAD